MNGVDVAGTDRDDRAMSWDSGDVVVGYGTIDAEGSVRCNKVGRLLAMSGLAHDGLLEHRLRDLFANQVEHPVE